MSRIMSIVIVTILGFTAVYIGLNREKFVKEPLPCEEPITYTLGKFDTKFGISKKYFLDALVEAEAIWEKPVAKDLFVYSPTGGRIAVNLIYDYRQEVTTTLSGLENAAAGDKAIYQALREKYDGLKSKYAGLKGMYDVHVRAFDERNALYQSHVDAWNASDRTSQQQFDQLESEKSILQKDIVEIRAEEAELNRLADEVNAAVTELNRQAKLLNIGVDTYNAVGALRGETFTGGDYRVSEQSEEIDIFEFSSREKLVRVLAHELGHALGLEHTSDPKSIMYYLNKSNTRVLSQTDLAALNTLCYNDGIKN